MFLKYILKTSKHITCFLVSNLTRVIMNSKLASVKISTTRQTGSDKNKESYRHLILVLQCSVSNMTVCLLIILTCLEDQSQLPPGSSPPVTAVPLSLKQKVDVDRQAKDIQPCLEQQELARGIYQHLPWEFGSGSVSLATKCMTVVRPGGNFSAIQQRSRILNTGIQHGHTAQ